MESRVFYPAKRRLSRYGLGYTVLESEKSGLAATLTCLAPIGADCELNKLSLTNRSTQTKRVQLYGAAEWCLWNAVDDSTNFQRNYNIS